MKLPAAPPRLSAHSAWSMARLSATWRALRDRQRTLTEWLYLGLWLLYLACYPFAVIGVAFDVRANFSMAWASSALLLIQGALAVLWLLQIAGIQRGGWLALAIACGGWLGETIGVSAGWPFGKYVYTDILFPRLPGSVPLPVIGAWLLVVVGAVACAQRMAANPTHPFIIWLASATVLGVALDLALEPVATRLEGYWLWQTHGPYYGVPTANFLGWAALCALLTGLTLKSLSLARTIAAMPPPAHSAYQVPNVWTSGVWLYGLTGAMFAMIDLTHGLWVAALVGGVTLVWIVTQGRRGI